MFTGIGIGILAGTLALGTGGAAVAAHQLGVPGGGGDRQARCETFQQRFAQNLGITAQQLQDTRKQTALQLIDEAAAGTLTPEQARRARDRVNASRRACERVGDCAPVVAHLGRVQLRAIAQQVGITARELVRELRGGRSLAQVAESHNVGRDELKATMHDVLKTELDRAVAAGRLTQEQADAALAAFDARLDTMVDRVMGRDE